MTCDRTHSTMFFFFFFFFFAAGSLLPTVIDATEAALGIAVASYAKATILEINGQDPVAYIAKFADSLGVYKDINARINQ